MASIPALLFSTKDQNILPWIFRALDFLFSWVVISIDMTKSSQKVCSLFQFPSSQEITLILEFNVHSQIFFQSLFFPIYADCYTNATATFLSGSKGHVIIVCLLFVSLLISPLLSYSTGYIILNQTNLLYSSLWLFNWMLVVLWMSFDV